MKTSLFLVMGILNVSISNAQANNRNIEDICPNLAGKWQGCEMISGPQGPARFVTALAQVWESVQDNAMIYHMHFPLIDQGQADVDWFYIVDKKTHVMSQGEDTKSVVEYQANCTRTSEGKTLNIESEGYMVFNGSKLPVGKVTHKFVATDSPFDNPPDSHDLLIDTTRTTASGTIEKEQYGCRRK